MYLRSALEHKFLEKVDDSIYSVTVELSGHGRCEPLVLVGYYRPPNYKNVHRFFSHFENLLSLHPRKNCLIVGDVNLNLLSDKVSGHCNVGKYSSLLASYGFSICNDKVTRSIKGTLLDHVSSNFVERESHACVTFDVDFSDHACVVTGIPFVGRLVKREITKHSTNFDEMRSRLSSSVERICQRQFSNASEYMASIVQALMECSVASTRIERRAIKETHLRCPWMNDHLRSMVIEDNKLFRLSKDPRYFGDESMKSRLRVSRQKVDKWDSYYSRMYYENMFRDTSDPKETWRKINVVLGRKKKSCPVGEISYEGRVAVEDESKASLLNSFFVEIGKKIASKFDKASKASDAGKFGTLRANRHSIFLEPVDEHEIALLIAKLDDGKSPGVDGVTVRMLKECSLILSPILADVLNLSIFTGDYPDCLKLAQVVPLFKEGDKSDPSNYRPISMLSVLNKLFEVVIYRRLMGFLDRCGFLYARQYGFRAKSGTHTAIYEILDRIFLDIDKGFSVSALFLDLQKAFDCVDHEILLYKMEMAGIRGVALRLFRSYLTGRKQCVSVGDAKSQFEEVGIGVPQGSVLGPVLFLIYINDVCDLPLFGSTALFADDTGIFYSNERVCENVLNMNADMVRVRDFLDVNRLTLNVGKTKAMHFRKEEESSAGLVSLDGHPIEVVRVFKYLGLHVDFRLVWDAHIAKMCSKLASVSGVLCKLKRLLPKSVLLKIYYGLAHSRLCYLPGAWGTANRKSIDELQVLQKRCLKHVNRLPLRYPTIDLFRTCFPRILNISGIIKYDVCSFVHKAISARSYNVLRFGRRSHAYNTRFKDLLGQPTVRSKSGFKAISAYGCSMFNSLPPRLRNIEPNRFQRELKKWLLANQYAG